jgi:hypothetical protein
MRPALFVLLLLVLAVVATSCGGDSGSGGDADTPGASPGAGGEPANRASVPKGEDPPGEFGPSIPRVICLDDEGNQRPCTPEEVEAGLRERSRGSSKSQENAGDADGSTDDVPDEDPDASLGPAQPNIICTDAQGNRRSCTPEEVDEFLHGGEPAAQRRPGGGEDAPETEDAQETEDPDAEDMPPDDQDGGAEPADEDGDAPAVEDETAPEADGP